MAIIKRALYAGERDGESLVQLIEPGSSLEKVASHGLMPNVAEFVAGLCPDDRYTYVLVNAMGYSEFFGPNSNRDWYGHNEHLGFNGLLHTPPGFGVDICKDREAGKRWPYGYPTFYGATVYAHHKNSDPNAFGFGDVVFATSNERMKRIELVMRVDHEECAKKGRTSILDRLRAGERVDVSMGCFRSGAEVLMADGTRKSIEDVIVGDRVLTHKGRARKVTEVHKRWYDGIFYAIRPEGESEFHCTVEHPFWALPNRAVKDTYRVWRDQPTEEPSWVYARHLLDGFVLTAPELERRKVEQPSHAMARLLGYYLADGHLLRSKKGELSGIHLTVGNENPALAEVAVLAEELSTKNPPAFAPHPHCDKAQYIYLHDPRVAEYCYRMVGQHEKAKQLHPDIFGWDPELLLSFLGAYANGDGHGTKKGELKFSTSSDGLASQLQLLLRTLGIPASRNALVHRAGTGFNREDTTEWVVHVGKQWASAFAPYCYKVQPQPVRMKKTVLKSYEGFWAVPMRSIEEYESSDWVYNLEVEEDESYIINGVSSHNCKVPFDLCSIETDWRAIRTAWESTYDPSRHAHPGLAILEYHKKVAPIRGLSVTRADYGEFQRKLPGRVLPDGRKVFVYNDFPRFFDISFVWIGADRTARVMWHMGPEGPSSPVGSPTTPALVIKRQTMAVKEAMEKNARLDLSKLAEIEKEIPATYAKIVGDATDAEPDLHPDLLRAMVDGVGTKGLLSTLGSLGIALKPHEFHVVISRGRPASEKVSSLALEKGATFSTLSNAIDDTYAVSAGHVDTEFGVKVADLTTSRSAFAPYLTPRLGDGAADGTKVAQVLESDWMQEVGAQYNGYRLSLLEQAPDVFPKFASIMSMPPEQLLKISSVGIAPLLLGLGPAVALISSHLRKREDSGKQLGMLGKFVADNPSFTTMATIGAGLRAAMFVGSQGGLNNAAKTVIRALT